MGLERRKHIAGLLNSAALIVKDAQALLDVSEVTCGGCKLRRANNWGEAKVAEQLKGILTKLVRFEAKLLAPPETETGGHTS